MNIAEILALLQKGVAPNDAIVQAAVSPGGGGGAPPDPPLPPPRPPDLVPPPNAGSVAPVPGGPPGGVPPAITGPAGAPGTPPAPPPTSVPKGAETPVTSPAPAADVPKTLQSPPDLANMYLELMKKNQNAQALDSGLTLIAAGFAQPANRANLISLAGQTAKNSVGMSDIVAAQKLQMEQAEKIAKIKMLPGIMKKYGFDQATVEYLNAEGTLDDVIKQLEQGKAAVQERADGSKVLIDMRTGEVIREIGGAKARETENITKADGSIVKVYKDTGEEVRPLGPAKVEDIKTKEVTRADGSKVLINERTGEVVKELTPAAERATKEITRADGSKYLADEKTGALIKELSPAKERDTENVSINGKTVKIYKDTGEVVKELGREKERETENVTHADGSVVKVYKDTGEVISVITRPRQITDTFTTDQQNLDTENKARKERGEPPMSMLEFKKSGGGSGTNIYTGDQGQKFPPPKAGYDYTRNPDGTVKVGANGQPTQYKIEGGPESESDAERTQKIGAQDEKTRLEYIRRQAASGGIKDAIAIGDDSPNMASGTLGTVLPEAFNQPRANLRAKLATLDAQQTLDQLKAMRSDPANKTGGALGQVSDFENRMLASVVGNLDQKQDWPTLRKALITRQAFLELMSTSNFGQNESAFKEALSQRVQELEGVYRKDAVNKRFDVKPKEQ